ncbi:MAG TPA: hypothetical protein VKG81_05840 [Mycobacterium sp.]|nr:hypothetical protein [Mycobacterium sp.]HME47617.1 hypothetical protein [Mycobacterium sp.]
MRLGRRLFNAIVLMWILIGVLAAWQRDYFQKPPTDCAHIGTVAMAIAAGPLNYLGENPRLAKCALQVPRPNG